MLGNEFLNDAMESSKWLGAFYRGLGLGGADPNRRSLLFAPAVLSSNQSE